MSARFFRNALTIPFVSLLAACAASPSGDASSEGDAPVATESSTEALSITSTPGKAVWTKVWRTPLNGPTYLGWDVATDNTGAAYLLRTQVSDDTIASLDVTRYAADGTLDHRTSLDNALDLGAPVLDANGGRVVVAATQHPSSAANLWVRVLDTDGARVAGFTIAATSTSNTAANVVGGTVAVDSNGSFVIVGGVSGDVDFGTGMLHDEGIPLDGFIAKYDRDGHAVFAHRYENKMLGWVDVDAAGNLYVTSRNTLDDSPPDPFGDIVVSKLDPMGAVLHTTTMHGNTRHSSIDGLAVAADGSAAIGGLVFSSTTIGDKTITEKTQTPTGDAWIGKLDPDGNVVYARAFEGSGNDFIRRVAIDSYGQPVFALTFAQGDFKIGSQTYSTMAAGEVGTVLAKMTATSGLVRWSRAYRADEGYAAQHPPTVMPRGLAITSSDRIMLSGEFFRDVDFGRGTISGGAYGTAFLTRFYQ